MGLYVVAVLITVLSVQATNVHYVCKDTIYSMVTAWNMIVVDWTAVWNVQVICVPSARRVMH